MKCCNYHSGLLKHVVTFQRKARVRKATGGFTESWSTLSGAPTRGFMKPLSGSEAYQADRVEAKTRNRLVVRYFSGLTEEDRVSFNSRVYNIRYIQNPEFADRWLVIDLDGGAAT